MHIEKQALRAGALVLIMLGLGACAQKTSGSMSDYAISEDTYIRAYDSNIRAYDSKFSAPADRAASVLEIKRIFK